MRKVLVRANKAESRGHATSLEQVSTRGRRFDARFPEEYPKISGLRS
jgi:hypothetical protein